MHALRLLERERPPQCVQAGCLPCAPQMGAPGAVSDSMPSAQRILHLARVHLVRTCGYGSLSLCQLFGALWSTFPFRGERPGGVTRRAEDTIALDWECQPVSSCTCFPRVAQGSTTEAPGWCRCACPARRASRRHGIVRASKGASAGWQELHAAAKFGPWNGVMRSTGQI